MAPALYRHRRRPHPWGCPLRASDTRCACTCCPTGGLTATPRPVKDSEPDGRWMGRRSRGSQRSARSAPEMPGSQKGMDGPAPGSPVRRGPVLSPRKDEAGRGNECTHAPPTSPTQSHPVGSETQEQTRQGGRRGCAPAGPLGRGWHHAALRSGSSERGHGCDPVSGLTCDQGLRVACSWGQPRWPTAP